MNVSTQDGINFRLEAVNSDDERLIDQLDNARAGYVISAERTPLTTGGHANTAIHLVADVRSEPALMAQSCRQAHSALSQLFSLGFSQAAKNGHVCTAPANPQAQEQLATCLVQIHLVLESLRDVVVQQEIMTQKIYSAHVCSDVVETCILKEQKVNTSNPPVLTPGQPILGGIYAGIAAADETNPAGHLVLLNDKPDDLLTWDAATQWAASLGNDARLPTRFESALIYANLSDQFDKDWHWTSTQCSSSLAWQQHFDDGSQYDDDKDDEVRARAVRRFPLESFNPLA